MTTPRRIQRKRTKGWRMPPNTIYVGRGSRWGNPCQSIRYPGTHDRAREVELYRRYVARNRWLVVEAHLFLRGKNLCCWCPLNQPCHADVLLELANNPLPKFKGQAPAGEKPNG